MYLIEISGDPKNVLISPTITRKYCNLDLLSDDIEINLATILSEGYDGLLKISFEGEMNFNNFKFACGSEICVQVEKEYLWQRVNITANVPVKIFSNAGLFLSVVKWFKSKLNK